MLSDTHCHLNFKVFDDDRSAVLERSRQVGVVRICNPAIDLPTSREIIQLADEFPEVYAAVGVHPNDALTWDEHSLGELRTLADHPKVVAIGEIGLDYYWERTPHDLQRTIFHQQLQLAQVCELPVIVHVRDTADGGQHAMLDVLEMLKEWRGELVEAGSPLVQRPGVLHSFSGNLADARKALDLGFYIGITGPITFRNAAALQQLVAHIPVDQLLIETDAPFLTPHPFRGKRNEPAHVRLVADKIADIHNQRLDAIAELTTQSAGRLFNW